MGARAVRLCPGARACSKDGGGLLRVAPLAGLGRPDWRTGWTCSSACSARRWAPMACMHVRRLRCEINKLVNSVSSKINRPIGLTAQ